MIGHLNWSKALAAAALVAGIAGTTLLYLFSDSQNAPHGWGSGPAMYARIRRRLPKVKLGYLLLLISFLLQGAALFAAD